MLKLGRQVKDKITGFEGILTSKHIYLTGCNQYAVQPKVNEKGEIPEARYFDEGRLEITGVGIKKSEVKGEKDGSDFRDHPTKS